ncbi:MAG: hypothetical protein RR989_02855 [Ruthenibacterium sp.]
MARNYCGSCGACLPEHATICPRCGRQFEAETPDEILHEPDEVKMLDDAAAAQEADTLAEAALLDGAPASEIAPESAPAQAQSAQAQSAQAQPVQAQSAQAQPTQQPAPEPKMPPHYARKVQTQTKTPELLPFSDCFGMLMVALVPIAGLVILLSWSFSEKTGVNRQNFARAILLIKIAISFVLFLRFALLTFAQFLYF